MATVWPFKPRAELIESVEWLTDVLPSRTSEERHCLREVPVRELELTHIADQADQALARQIMRGDGDLLVPDWTRLVRADAYTGAAVDLPDGDVLVWRDARTYEQTTVAGGVLGTVTTPVNNVRVMPLLSCRVSSDWTSTRAAGEFAEGSITVQTLDGDTAEGDGGYATYAGYALMTDRVVVGAGTFDEGVTWDADVIDGGIGLPVDVRTQTYAAEAYYVRWYLRGDAYQTLRRWLYSLRGRWIPFWLPSWAAGDLPNPSRTGPYLLADQFDENETHIIAEVSGTLYPRAVVSAELVGEQWQILLDEALPAGTLTRAMYLRLVRFNADRIEFRHAAAEAVAVAVQCVGVPT